MTCSEELAFALLTSYILRESASIVVYFVPLRCGYRKEHARSLCNGMMFVMDIKFGSSGHRAARRH
jgi:hypothetical protein